MRRRVRKISLVLCHGSGFRGTPLQALVPKTMQCTGDICSETDMEQFSKRAKALPGKGGEGSFQCLLETNTRE